MSRVLKYHKRKGVVIRHVIKAGINGYDTPYSLLIYNTLKEAKEAVDIHIENTSLISPKLAQDIERLVKENHERRKAQRNSVLWRRHL